MTLGRHVLEPPDLRIFLAGQVQNKGAQASNGTVMAESDPNATAAERGPTRSSHTAHSELVGNLFREHNDALVRFITGRLHSQQEAKEVAQEAYVRLLQLDLPGAVSYLRAFLFKTAANLAADRLRARQRERQVAYARLFDQLEEVRTPERVVTGTQE